MNRIANKRAIVTGGASGIGRACVERLALEGAQVAIFDVRDEDGHALVSALNSRGLQATYRHVDVSSESTVKAAIDDVARRFGGLEILVNNAGIARPFKARTETVTEADWDRLFAVNVKGVLFNTKHSIPHMRASGGGSIVNMCSICGMIGFGALAPYHGSKGAVRQMSRNDAIDYAADRIRVNAVFPGWIWTGMSEEELRESGESFEAAKAAAANAQPISRMGVPDDVAWAVLYLASDEASFVTGAELVVDGGYTAR